jgi:glycosyltransferase involved in cell wall biosynthesis
MATPLVSILIPAYNAEKWIDETIRSALNQTWNKKEIIVIDDGSHDSTLEIAKRYESRSVKIVSQNNAGACAARNKALTLAQGDFIQWLDADDILASDKISKQLMALGESRDSRILLTCSWGKFFNSCKRAKFKSDSLWQDLSPVEWIVRRLGDGVWMNPTVWLLSRYLAVLAGDWDERLAISGDDDGEYICRVVAASEGVKFVKEAQCFYRIGNSGSLDWKMGESEERLESLFLSMSLCINHLRSLEDSQKTRDACLKYLQIWRLLFYPEQKALLIKMDELADRLGGVLFTPCVSLKYSVIAKLFGWCTAKKAVNRWRRAKLKCLRSWDSLILVLNGE